MIQIDWVFLDAGNTLVTLDFDFIRALLEASGIRTSVDALQRSEWTARRLIDQPKIVRGSTDRERWMPFFQALLDGIGVGDPGLCGKLLPLLEERQRARNLWRSVPPEVPGTLASLRHAGYRLAVISNSDGRIDDLLRELELRAWFDFVVDSGREGVEKPDPRIFRIAVERARTSSGRALYCGDLYHVDIEGAQAAGLHAVLLDPAGTFSDTPCPRIRAIEDLPSLLRMWSGAGPVF